MLRYTEASSSSIDGGEFFSPYINDLIVGCNQEEDILHIAAIECATTALTSSLSMVSSSSVLLFHDLQSSSSATGLPQTVNLVKLGRMQDSSRGCFASPSLLSWTTRISNITVKATLSRRGE